MRLLIVFYVYCILFSVQAYSDELFPLAYEEITSERCSSLAKLDEKDVKEKQDFGICLLTEVVGANPAEGLLILETLIDESGDPYAMHNYGYMYLEKKESRPAALEYLLAAAKNEVPESMYMVTTFMLNDEYKAIVDVKHDEVLYRISKGALKAGVDGARYTHALVLLKLYRRFPEESLKKTAETLLLAEAEGNAQAAYLLGSFYVSGEYFKLDKFKGYGLIRNACAMGEKGACKKRTEKNEE